MGTPVFASQVNWVNQLLLPRALYPAISVPPAMTVYDAIPKTMAEMVTISIDRRNRYAYQTESNYSHFSFPAGYTRSDLAVRFENLAQQWQCRDGSWTFCGGRIRLELTLAVYADNRAAHKPRCWAMILEHELLHAHDEIDIAKNFLPRTLSVSPIVRGFLGQPIRDAEFNETIRGSGSGEGSLFERRIQSIVWIPESSRRAAQLHAQQPGDGPAIQQCISAP